MIKSPCFSSDVHMHKTTIKLQIAANGKLIDGIFSTTKHDAEWGTESGALNR